MIMGNVVVQDLIPNFLRQDKCEALRSRQSVTQDSDE
jgi:hypothetical protein